MKNGLLKLLLIAFVVLLTSCEKTLLDDSDTASTADANVVLKLSIYDQIPFGTRSVQDITALCTRLNIAFFQDGTKVKTVSQKAGDSTFGTVGVTLDEGTYQLVVIAHSSDGSATITSEEKVTFPSNLVTDVFYFYGELTVNSTQTVYNLQLKRAVSMFRLELTSGLPANAAKIRFYYTGGSSTFSPYSGYGCVNSRQTVMMNVTSSQRVFEVYTFPHEETDELKIVVTVYNSSDDILKEHTFENVPVTRNMITQYTGDFDGGGGTSGGGGGGGTSTSKGLNMKAESDWGGTDSYTF